MLRTRLAPTTRRRGFTLVEILVAAALCIVIMTILALAFQSGLQTLSHLKSAVSLSEQLRTAEDLMRRDLAADHLEDDLGRPVKISQIPGPWRSQPNALRKGYFTVRQPSVPVQTLDATAALYDQTTGTLATPTALQLAKYPYLAPVGVYDGSTPLSLQNRSRYPFQYEGTEDGIDSYRATDHTFSMTVKLSGKSAQDVFAADILPTGLLQLGQAPFSRLDLDPTFGNQLVAQWAEVVWFLRPVTDPVNGITAEFVDPNNPTNRREKLQLYSLHRSQRVLSPLPASFGFTPTSIAQLNKPREAVPDLSVQSIKPLGYDVTTLPPNTTINYPGYPAWKFGQSPWMSTPLPTTAVINTPDSVTDPSNRTEYIPDWPNFQAAGGNSPPLPVPMLPMGYALTNPTLSGPNAIQTGNGVVVTPPKVGSDLVLNNVLSMEVRVITDAPNSGLLARHLPPYFPPAAGLPTFAGGTAPFAIQGRMFDTYHGGTVGGTTTFNLVPHHIRAIQIKLRVYDIKNKMTRQMTITQDL